MKKFYVLIIFLLVGLSYGNTMLSQTNNSSNEEQVIKGLTVHPNPVTDGKVYITTSQNLVKDIEIFDVLGKKIHSSTLFGEELNVSKLSSGVYIIKIKENNITATRKLVIR